MRIRGITLIWRYVFKEVIGPTLLGLTLYVLVFLMNALFELAELAIKKDLPLATVLKILYFFLPRVLVLSLPMAILLGSLVGIGRLSTDSEVIALRASGVSYWKILAPVLFIGLLGWTLGSVLTLKIEPDANYRRHRITTELLYTADLRREIKPRVFFEELPDILLYADEVHQSGDFLDRVFIHQQAEDGEEIVTLARRAQVDYDPEDGVAEIYLESGTTHSTTPEDSHSYQVSRFVRQKLVKPPGEQYKMKSTLLSRPAQKNFGEQSLDELTQSIRKAQAIPHAETRDRVVGRILFFMHERFALPFACFAFAIVGVPLGILNRRGGKASGFTLSIGIAIVYWILLSVGENLVSQGRLSPYIGLWMGNVLLAAIGISLFFMRERFEGIHLSYLIPNLLVRSLRRRRFSASVPGLSDASLPPGVTPIRDDDRPPALPRTAAALVSDEEASGEQRPGTSYSVRWHWLLIILIGAAGAALGFMKVNPFILVALAFLGLILVLSTTLDRYVLGRFTTTLIGCAISFFTLFAVYEFVNLIDDLVERDLPITMALSYLEFRSPWILAQILPISCLVATMLAFGVMSRFNEVIATKASGISIYRLATPVLLVTLALCTLAYVNHDSLLPYSNRKAVQIKDVIRGRSPRSYQSRQERWVFGDQGRLYNFKNYLQPPIPVLPAANTGTFQGFSVYYLDPATFTLLGRVYGREASYTGDRWVLRDGWERKFSSGAESFETFAAKEFDFAEGPSYFIREWKTPDQMSFNELRRFAQNLRQRGYDAQELTVDLYGKTAFPLLPLTMVIVALPFCFQVGKRGSLYGVGVAIALIALFLLVFSTTNALGGIGLMPPFLAAWSPNLLFAGTGIYMLLRSGT